MEKLRYLKTTKTSDHKRRVIAKLWLSVKNLALMGKGYGVKFNGERTRGPRGPRITEMFCHNLVEWWFRHWSSEILCL